MNATSLTEKNM